MRCLLRDAMYVHVAYLHCKVQWVTCKLHCSTELVVQGRLLVVSWHCHSLAASTPRHRHSHLPLHSTKQNRWCCQGMTARVAAVAACCRLCWTCWVP